MQKKEPWIKAITNQGNLEAQKIHWTTHYTSVSAFVPTLVVLINPYLPNTAKEDAAHDEGGG